MAQIKLNHVLEKNLRGSIMRIAVISDIHGNCVALEAVLADIQRRNIDQIVCLGDAIQGGPQPAETVQRLRDLACPVVMGNADAWMLTGIVTSGNETISPAQLAVREWSLSRLSAADQAYIAQFSPTLEIAMEADKKLLCFHGSPHNFDDIILPNTPQEDLHRFLDDFNATLFAGGHTHNQQWRRLGAASWYLNPGSIGLAWNWQLLDTPDFRADPWANYAIVSSEGAQLNVEFLSVPFDIDLYVAIVRSSGKPFPEGSISLYQK
jgi:putative phosphoesterase